MGINERCSLIAIIAKIITCLLYNAVVGISRRVNGGIDMFLGLPGFAWFVIGVIVVAVLVTVVNWYIMYCVFDWAVHHVKHVWLDED